MVAVAGVMNLLLLLLLLQFLHSNGDNNSNNNGIVMNNTHTPTTIDWVIVVAVCPLIFTSTSSIEFTNRKKCFNIDSIPFHIISDNGADDFIDDDDIYHHQRIKSNRINKSTMDNIHTTGVVFR